MIRALDILRRLLSPLPHGALLRFGRGLGWLAGTVARVRRREVVATLRRCFPGKSAAECSVIASGMYAGLGQTIVECLRYGGPEAKAFLPWVDIVGDEHLRQALERGRGCLVMMGHFGNWELMGTAAAGRMGKVNVVVRPQRNRAFDEYWRERRQQMGLTVLPHVHAYRECLRSLSRGEGVAIIIDQNMRRHRGIFVDFFGTPACTTPGLAYLSAQSRAPVLPVYMVRELTGRHTLRILPMIEPPADREPATIHAATQEYTRVFEEIVRKHPDQWLWLHRRWRTRPEQAINRPAAQA